MNMYNVEKHLEILGMKAEDKISGLEGVIVSVSFDLYGCIQAILSPPVKKHENKIEHGHWLDVGRLKIIDRTPVITPPDFEHGAVAKGSKGAAPKPSL